MKSSHFCFIAFQLVLDHTTQKNKHNSNTVLENSKCVKHQLYSTIRFISKTTVLHGFDSGPKLHLHGTQYSSLIDYFDKQLCFEQGVPKVSIHKGLSTVCQHHVNCASSVDGRGRPLLS